VEVPDQVQEFQASIAQVTTLFTSYNKCLRLIENSIDEAFTEWERLEECVEVVASHPRVSEKMKMRCFLINRDNVRTYRLLQDNFQVDLNTLFYMGKMNLLHISCDIGWSSLAEELVLRTGMEVEQRCPSLHMRPASLTPLMLAAGAGHTKVVAALLQSEVGVDTEAKDGYGMTALFHTCNHGLHRVGDQHGHFRRLWSWDLSPDQLTQMEELARAEALNVVRLLVRNGASLQQRDKTGASLLTRAASVDNFESVIDFLLEAGCRVTENILNWVKVRNPGLTGKVEEELKTPGPLLRQSRCAVWRAVALSGPRSGYLGRLQTLGAAEVPGVLNAYLQCSN